MKIAIYAAVLSIFLLIIPKSAIAQGASKTNADGTTTTTGPSNEYGEGGTIETTSDKKYQTKKIVHRDKCGRIRETWEKLSPYSREYPDERREHYSPDGKSYLVEEHFADFDTWGYESGPPFHKPDAKEAKEMTDKWKKAPIPPCPEPAQKTTDHPEKPKEQPNPIGKLLQNVSVGIGVSGGHTVGRNDHAKDRHRTSSTTKKTVTAGCKCHPCTCSPCRCH